jgi:hypothetical protein
MLSLSFSHCCQCRLLHQLKAFTETWKRQCQHTSVVSKKWICKTFLVKVLSFLFKPKNFFYKRFYLLRWVNDNLKFKFINFLTKNAELSRNKNYFRHFSYKKLWFSCVFKDDFKCWREKNNIFLYLLKTMRGLEIVKCSCSCAPFLLMFYFVV